MDLGFCYSFYFLIDGAHFGFAMVLNILEQICAAFDSFAGVVMRTVVRRILASFAKTFFLKNKKL